MPDKDSTSILHSGYHLMILRFSGRAKRRHALIAVLASMASAVPTMVRAEAPSDQMHLPAGSRIGDYVGGDVMIPMRDGVRLHAEVWRPKTAMGKLPILMQRSPYGFGLARVGRSFDAEYKELAKDGFIFVLEDIRGRFGSEGDFVMLRPSVAGSKTIDESTDAYDSIDWLMKNVPGTNGKAGIFGVSYLGWTTAMATIDPHPALKAVSVQASPEDMFIGDDFHHNGAFRLDYAWEYAAALETDGRTMNAFGFGKSDPYNWYLKQQGTLATLDRRSLGKTLPSWQEFVAHPNYDAFHKVRVTTAAMPAHPAVPNLIVAGWWDQEDFYGPLTIYKRQEPGDADNHNYLVVGPWNHGGWVKPGGDHYGPFALGSDTATYFRAQVELPWFRHWLKGEGALDQPEALIFETGSNQWRKFASWPPKDGVNRRHLYLRAGGLLSFDAPTSADDANDRFVSDPANPVPYRPHPVSPVMADGSSWPAWQADDQAAFAKRPDVLSWQTAVLDHDVTLRGAIMASLFASTTGTDADWIVKLIDVYPADAVTPEAERGRQLMIADDVFRGRFRTGFEKPVPIAPGKVLPYAIDLHSGAHVFKAGHRIAVQVQSSWFPLIDRNPQTFVPSIFDAKPSDYKAQTHKIFHSPAYPSAIDVDIADAATH
jgi:putative CocE/NonD family hydrolase